MHYNPGLWILDPDPANMKKHNPGPEAQKLQTTIRIRNTLVTMEIINKCTYKVNPYSN